jgi:solute carrier family 45, member 1/2/4
MLQCIVQAGIRAFIVDGAPAHQQESANAWAGRLTGAGNIIGYILAYSDLPKVLPFFGNTQFKVLCLIASFSLGITLLISCLYIKERDPRLDGPPPAGDLGLVSFFKGTVKSIRNLPPQIRKVCEVQLAAWIGWFPFLYYSTTYIGQIYVNPIFEEHRNLSDEDINKAWEAATRIGSFALLVNAIICFTSNIVLPLIIVPSYNRIEVPAAVRHRERRGSLSDSPDNVVYESLLDHGNNRDGGETTLNKKEKKSKMAWFSATLQKLRIPGLTLRRTWLFSHVLFALCMFSTIFITSIWAATVVIGIIGISWAVTLWAPFALISAEVAQRDAERRLNRLKAELENENRSNDADAVAAEADVDRDEENEDIEASAVPKIESTDQAGIVLGLHNVAISMPQILSTIVSSLIFRLLQKPRGEPWDDSVGWVMRFGGCAAVVAAFLTSRLDKKRAK